MRCALVSFCQILSVFLSAVEASLFVLHSALLLLLRAAANGNRTGPSDFPPLAPLPPGREVYAALGVSAPLSQLPLSASFASPSRRALLGARVQELANVHPELPSLAALMERLRHACSVSTYVAGDPKGVRLGAREEGRAGTVTLTDQTRRGLRKHSGVVREGVSAPLGVVAFLAERIETLICSFADRP